MNITQNNNIMIQLIDKFKFYNKGCVKMSIPTEIANELLTDCQHRCCKCHTEAVQLHHIRYISEDGDNSYDNLIPLCPNCHNLVHTTQAAAGKPGVVTRAITPDQLRLYKSKWIEYCKNVKHIKGGLAEPSNWHYYWHKDRIPALWNSLMLPSKSYQKRKEDTETFNRELSDKLIEFIKSTGVWDLYQQIEDNQHNLINLIGTYVTLKGHFNSEMKQQGFYIGDESEWDQVTLPNLSINLNIGDNSFKVNLDINPHYVTTGSSFLKLRLKPYIQVIGHVWNVNPEDKEIFISPLHMCPNS